MAQGLTDQNEATRDVPAARRGRLRVLLGAAPGSGKTFAMLREGIDRRRQGEDVVVGFVEAHGRPRTIAAIGSLEVVPRLVVDYHGRTLEDTDVDAVIARHPQVALVDELAHTNAAGMRHEKRWQDVEELRDNGIDVITTVNVQHLESIKDLVEHIAGVPVRETVPDRILDGADEVQFIDISPEALRKRMRHGNIYPAAKVDTALSNFFRPGNLTALREIALRLVGQNVGARRGEVKAQPEDVLVAVSGAETSEALIRRGSRIARRTDAVCTVLSVVQHDARDAQPGPERWKAVAEQVGALILERPDIDVAAVIEATARELLAQHLVIGESPLAGGFTRWRRTLADRLIHRLRDVDVHVLSRHALPQRATNPQSYEDQRPEPDALLRKLKPIEGTRGTLRVYLGYARGCGTTMALLDEARRRKSRGTDVVVASIRTYGRAPCETAAGDLELLGGPFGKAAQGILDVDALLARNPQVACIDDISGVDDKGRPRVDVLPQIVAAGITVIGTLHLTDLKSTVDGLGSLLPRDPAAPPVDDRILSLVDEIELVDVTPSVLEERLRRGEILPLSNVAQALQGEFRPELLDALREMAFRVIADHTDRRLVAYMRERGIERPWEARPRVLACVPPKPGMERLIRRTAALAAAKDAEFKAVTVRTRRRSDTEKQFLGAYVALTHKLGGEFVTLTGSSVAREVAKYARQNLVTEIALTRGPHRRFHRGPITELVRIMSDVDIHVLAEQPGDNRR
jgi:two-component system sensor histidine kinase KdpD